MAQNSIHLFPKDFIGGHHHADIGKYNKLIQQDVAHGHLLPKSVRMPRF